MPQPYSPGSKFPLYIGYGFNADGFSYWDGNMTVTSKTTAEGLIGSQVNAIAVKSETEVYIATDQGISVWNGTSFTNYGPSQGFIGWPWAIAVAPNGSVYCGTNNGLYILNGTTLTNYTTANGLLGNYCKAIAIDTNGNAYIGHGDNAYGISKIDSSLNITQPFTSAFVEAINISEDGVIYFTGNYSTTVATWDGTTNFPGSLPPMPFSQNTGAYGITSNAGSVYVLAGDPGNPQLCVWNGTSWSNYGPSSPAPSEYFQGIAVSPTGTIFVGCFNGITKGLYEFVTTPSTGFNIPLIAGVGGLLSNNIKYLASTPAVVVTPTNVKVVGTKIVGDVTVDPTTVDVKYNNAAVTTGSVLRNTVTGYKYLKATGGIRVYDVIPATPDSSWSWTTGADAWTNLQNT